MTTDTHIEHKLSLLALAHSTDEYDEDADETNLPEEEVDAIDDDEQFKDEEDFIEGSPVEELEHEEGEGDDNPLEEHSKDYDDGNREE